VQLSEKAGPDQIEMLQLDAALEHRSRLNTGVRKLKALPELNEEEMTDALMDSFNTREADAQQKVEEESAEVIKN